jgi:hypothetical protein
MYNRLLGHLNNNMLVEEQFGFIKNLRTIKETYELIYEIFVLLMINCARDFSII